MIKTYKDWDCDLHEYLQIGDEVDEEMYYYFLEVLPPVYDSDRLVQIGESYSISKEGKETYSTLENINGKWIYKGHCHVGENIHQG